MYTSTIKNTLILLNISISMIKYDMFTYKPLIMYTIIFKYTSI